MKCLLPILLLVFSVGAGAVDEDDLQQLLATKQCKKCDLSGANLYRKNILPNSNAYGKVGVGRINLSGANLSGANLKKAYLYKAQLYNANLSGANLSGANLYKAKLYKVNLQEANLYKTQLYKAYLSRANLSGANLKTAYLYKANLNKADLSGANLTDAHLEGALHFETVNTAGAIFCRTVMPNGLMNNSECFQGVQGVQGFQRAILVFMTQWSEMWWELLR